MESVTCMRHKRNESAAREQRITLTKATSDNTEQQRITLTKAINDNTEQQPLVYVWMLDHHSTESANLGSFHMLLILLWCFKLVLHFYNHGRLNSCSIL